MARLLAFILFALALAAGINDVILSADSGKPFEFMPIGQYWFEYHPSSLMLLQPALERYGFEFLWDPVMLWLLVQPAAPAFAIAAIVLRILFGRKRRSPRPAAKPNAARKPRMPRRATTQRPSPTQNAGQPHAGPHRAAHTAQSGPVRRMR